MPFDGEQFYCLDGGFGSHLTHHFKAQIEADPLWSSKALHEDREAVIKTHEDFLRAGADILTTNTYQASADLFRKHIAFADPVGGPDLLLEDAVRMASEAVSRVATEATETKEAKEARPLIAASVGPYGACLGDGSEYNGSYIDTVGRETLKKWHLDRMRQFAKARVVDIYAAETFPSVEEALAFLDALQEIPGATCWISFSCRDGTSTARGETLDEVFKALVRHPGFASLVSAVGVNCVDPKEVSSQLKTFNTANFLKVPYVVYPNSGSVRDWDAEKKCWTQDGNANVIFDHVKEWMCLGANVIGGCCRVTPEDIKKIKSIMVSSVDEVKRYREAEG